ncbi:hypothetical protein HYV84_05130 [Candidatus Woesearchaeota archaeon]|nr:hypothetical protein [Candidatus Woesearchaeota archaeon]
MRPFHSFLDSQEVNKISPDVPLANSLFQDAESRFHAFFPFKEPTKFVFENGYEAIRELMDSLLALRGFKSYSHEAPISFLLEQDILNEKEAKDIDHIRYLRNRSKYYGKQFSPIELGPLLEILLPIYGRIKEAVTKELTVH